MRSRLLVLLAACSLATVGSAAARDLVALGEDGGLVRFPPANPAAATVTEVSGVGGHLVGIDWRPADGRLWGLSDRGDLYRIDLPGASATLVATLTIPFAGGIRSGIDFTPQNDRLRLLDSEGQNLRAQVQLGATARDESLSYEADDPNQGRQPEISAAAYDHDVPGADATTLYAIDSAADVLVRIDPPNDGRMRTVGPLGVDLGPLAGFEIVSDPGGMDTAYVAAGSRLYRLDLATGRATAAGTIGDGKLSAVSLAAAP